MSPQEAVNRYIRRRSTDAADSTLRSYENRLQTWVDWCDEQGIDTLADLTPLDVDDYQIDLQQYGDAPATVRGRLSTLQVHLKYLARINVIDDAVVEAVDVPTLTTDEAVDDTRLAPEDATALLQQYRDSRARQGRPTHVTLEILWHVGCRMGALRALDLGDVDLDDGTLQFRDRRQTGTPLKPAHNPERMVGLPDAAVQALRTYVARERPDVRDEHGRAPLVATRQGRASSTSIRGWCYQATQPCLHTDCPHGRSRGTCEWTERNAASKCPSSRSPHPIRSGSIQWQLHRGVTLEDVALRVNSSPSTIRRHYDLPGDEEAFRERREHVAARLSIDAERDEGGSL